MASLLYLQTLCSVTYAEHEGNPVVSGLGIGAQPPAPGQERRIAHLPPASQAAAAGSMGMVLPPSCIPKLCQFGSQQDLQVQQRSELPPANFSPGKGRSVEVRQGREKGDGKSSCSSITPSQLQSWACSFSYRCTALPWARRGLARCAPCSQACSGQINLETAFPDRCWRTGPSPTSYQGIAASYQPGWPSGMVGDAHNLLGGVQESQTYSYYIV